MTPSVAARSPAGAARPRVCIVGPLLGSNPGWVTSPAEVLAGLLSDLGYPVATASGIPNRLLRLADIARTLIAERRRADVCLLQVYSGPSFVVEDIASRLASRFAIPLIVVLHGGALPQFMARRPGWSTRVLSRAKERVAPSRYLARAIAAYGLSSQVIPNQIRMADYPHRLRRDLRPRLLWMRTFHPIYNPEMALRSFARVRERRPDATLAMAGQEKGLGGRVRSLAKELGFGDAVRFPGFLDTGGKAREGDAADIFLNTNHIDNMPVSVVEACAMGLPVVATAVGGVPDLLSDGDTGLLVPDGHDAEMADAVCRLLMDPDLAERLSTRGRTVAEESSWERVRPLWESLIERTVSMTGDG